MDRSIAVSAQVLQDCLGLKSTETLLVVTDDEKFELAQSLYEAGEYIGAETMLMLMKERDKPGQEPPKAIHEAMKQADAVVCITKHSLTHTRAKKAAVTHGTRVATMPGITREMFYKGAITADYHQVKLLTEQMAEVLSEGSQVKIVKDGEELTFSIKNREGIASTGMLLNPGDSGNLPSGEAYIAPIEGTGSGRIKVDGSIGGIGTLDTPLWLIVQDGQIVHAEGNKADQLLELLGNGKGRMLAEFGIGTNDRARITGIVLEDEKVYGTIHIAFGSNRTFGGTIEAGVHIDLVVQKPDVYIDGVKVMDEGIAIF